VVHIASMGATLEDAVKSMTELQVSFPIGWAGVATAARKQDPPGVGQLFTVGWVEKGAGWLVMALGTLFGAPFWLDVLQSVIRLKGSGPSPEEKRENRAAAA
ncbi:MAG: hypothetical protein ACREFP_14500, partial [Acetobacteraceae bacterium]